MNDARTDRSTPDGPGCGTEDVLAVLERELSRPDRLRYLAVGLASLVVTAVTGALWVTEASLPLRTHLDRRARDDHPGRGPRRCSSWRGRGRGDDGIGRSRCHPEPPRVGRFSRT